jgi:uncharacterized protein (TIGR03790 family)
MPFFVKRLITRFLVTTLFISIPWSGWSQPDSPGPEAVAVVANSAMEGSLEVAQAYMRRRSIPKENLIVIESSIKEHIPRGIYLETIHNPILQALIDKELIDAFEAPVDELGRKGVTLFTSKIKYMVLCYGVPTRVINFQHVQGWEGDEPLLARQFKRARPDLYQSFSEGELGRTEASVDGELALILKRGMPLRGFIPNPLYQNTNPGKKQDIIRVTRLDGPSPKAVIRMIDNALAGERKGLRGRAYVDEDSRKGGYLTGNEWLAKTAEVFRGLGYDLDHDKKRSTFIPSSRFDAPVLYAGWYSNNRNGPFILPKFSFPEGAVAAHLHSFSAKELRSTTKGWVGPLVDRGVSATFGNVAEPYLRMTHQFNLFFAALADGWNFADAAYYALPALSWQGVSIGDPLYRPFNVSQERQMESVGDPLSILEDQYVVIRQINLLVADGQFKDAKKLASRGMRDTPGPALALRRAQLYMEEDNREKALTSLSFARQLPLSGSSDWGLYATIADTLSDLGDAESGLQIYKTIEQQKMPEHVMRAFLKRGIKVAQEAGNPGLAIEWKARSTPPPPPPKKEKTAQAPKK